MPYTRPAVLEAEYEEDGSVSSWQVLSQKSFHKYAFLLFVTKLIF